MQKPPSHELQFYEDDVFLASAVARYLAEGVRAGDRLIVIATTDHQQQFIDALSAAGTDADALIASGELTMLDARAMLEQISRDGEAQQDLFERHVGTLVREVSASGRRLRAYGEMVDLLWRDGRPLDARQLEVFWNRLGEETDFSLLCAYGMDAIAKDVDDVRFDDISRQHSKVIPAEGLAVGNEEERAVDVGRLQQRARALEHEVRLRKTVDQAMREARDARYAAEQTAQESRRALAAQVQGLEILHGMSLRLLGTHHVGTLLEGVLVAATELSGTDMGMLSLTNEPPTSLRIGASLGLSPEVLTSLARVESGTGACGQALAQRQRVIIEDVEADPTYTEFLPIARDAGFRAVHSTPLVTRHGDVLGVLTVHFRTPRRPPPDEIQRLDLCARQAVDLIENANLYARLRTNDRRKDEFLAVLAHELRNPLAPIQNAVAIVRSTVASSTGGAAALDVIERQVRHMARLVDDLTDLSRITTGRLELRTHQIELGQLLEAALETSRPLIDAAGRELTVRRPTTHVTLEGDVTRLAQVLANLLNNAVKYSDPGGRITLEAQVDRPGGHVTISVRDTGIGMTPELAERVFNVFDNPVDALSRSRGGLGVGLTLSRRIIELHGGTIDAYSPGPGRGSRFTIRLPLLRAWEINHDGDRAPAAGLDGEAQPSDSESLRILVVDDNVDSAETMALLLSHLGHEVRTAHDGQQAVDAAEDFRPQAILLDIGLPIRSGLEVARELRQRPWTAGVTIIAMSGWGQDTDRKNSREAGFDSHLVKPIDHVELQRLLAARAQAEGDGRPPAA